MLVHIISYYGILAGAVIIALITLLIVKSFRISLRQKNQLGMIVGMGCSLILAVETLSYVAANMGILNFSSITLPFFLWFSGNSDDLYPAWASSFHLPASGYHPRIRFQAKVPLQN